MNADERRPGRPEHVHPHDADALTPAADETVGVEPPRIRDFRLLKHIGMGSFGEVWLAEETLSGVERAVKLIPKAPTKHRTASESDENRERELAGLRQYMQKTHGHPNLLQVFHVGETDQYLYYVMEKADNAAGPEASSTGAYAPTTLASVMRRSVIISPVRALDICREILSGLDHLHRCGLVHRDVKPGNVLVVREKMKLADIGLVSRMDRDLTQVGTLGYIPPDGIWDATADLYAVGMILYEMVTGQSRFRFPELPTALMKTRRDMAALSETNRVLTMACHPARGQRFRSAAAFISAIDRAKRVITGAVGRRRSRAAVALAAVLVLAVVGVAAAGLVSGRLNPFPGSFGGGPAKGADGKAQEARLTGCAGAAASLVAAADLPAQTREAMLTVLRQHPGQTRWGGTDGRTMFAMAGRPVPAAEETAQRSLAALLRYVGMAARRELLLSKGLLDAYTGQGLIDATTLRRAVQEVAPRISIEGSVKGATNGARREGGFVVAYVLAPPENLRAYLMLPAELEKIREGYRDVMHAQARLLMRRENWTDALLLWRHLHQRGLVSQTLYLDAARCLSETGNPQEALGVLAEAYRAFAPDAALEWLEQCGDLALGLGEIGEDLAQEAYQSASSRLLESVSDGTMTAE